MAIQRSGSYARLFSNVIEACIRPRPRERLLRPSRTRSRFRSASARGFRA
jgi:hypothetical protein